MSLTTVLDVRVFGLPVPQGRPRARAFQVGGATRVQVYDPEASRDWKRTVAAQVLPHKPEAPVAEAPLEVRLLFHLPRPQSLPKRVRHHIRKPDIDNLAKAVKDALRGIVYRDDSQVVDLHVRKVYGTSPGVEIRVDHVLEAPLPVQAELRS